MRYSKESRLAKAKEVRAKIEEKYIIHSQFDIYTDQYEMLDCECVDCKTIKKTSIKSLLNSRCQRCYHNSRIGAQNSSRRKSWAEYKEYVSDDLLYDEDMFLDNELVCSDTKIQFTHGKCGHSFTWKIKWLHKQKGCPRCTLRDANAKNRLTQSGFESKVLDLYGAHEWDISDVEYTHSRDYTDDIIHIPCGEIQRKQFTVLTSGNAGCPFCKETKGEKAIRKYFERLGISIDQEATFDKCISDKGNKLRFDAYIEDYDLIIEYHGKQHYEHDPFFFKTQKEFERQKELDVLKRTYAERNHNYLEIKYTDFDDIDMLITTQLLAL